MGITYCKKYFRKIEPAKIPYLSVSRMFVFGKNIIFSCYRGQAK